MEEMRKKAKEILAVLNGCSIDTAEDVLRIAKERLESNSVVNVKIEEE